MADWRTIADTEVDPDAPVTSELAYAFRDNPIAIAEGSAGAPGIGGAMARVQDNFEVGSYIMAASGEVTLGQVVAGSSLRPSGAAKRVSHQENTGSAWFVDAGQGELLSGSWRCCGHISVTTAQNIGLSASTLFQRIA